jgi:hypothetical protein
MGEAQKLEKDLRLGLVRGETLVWGKTLADDYKRVGIRGHGEGQLLAWIID